MDNIVSTLIVFIYKELYIRKNVFVNADWCYRALQYSTMHGEKQNSITFLFHLFSKQNKYTSNFSSYTMYMSTSFGTKTIEMLYRFVSKRSLFFNHSRSLSHIHVRTHTRTDTHARTHTYTHKNTTATYKHKVTLRNTHYIYNTY